MSSPPLAGTSSDAVAMTRMYSAENGDVAAVRDVDDRRDEQQVEHRLQIQEGRARTAFRYISA